MEFVMIQRKLLLFLLILCMCIGVCTTPEACAGRELSSGEWTEDLDFLARKLPEVHLNLFFKLPRKDFEEQVRQISDSIPSMTDLEICIAFKKLIASIGDGHTGIDGLINNGVRYPFLFRLFSDGVYVVAAGEKYRSAIGARLTGIGDHNIKNVRRKLRTLIPLENKYSEYLHLTELLSSADVLYGLHILTEENVGTFHFKKNKKKFTFSAHAYPDDQQEDPLITIVDTFKDNDIEIPLYQSNVTKCYWFRYLSKSRTLYIQYNRCKEMQSLSFAEFTKQIMAVDDENPVDNVIMDMRHNYGGYSRVIDPLYAALKKRPVLMNRARLYVLISPFTYSSGFMNSTEMLYIKGWKSAKLVGEPSAQKPNSYGDIRNFKLPNSDLTVYYSTQYYNRFSGDRDFFKPNIPVKMTSHDFFSGRDPVMERLLK